MNIKTKDYLKDDFKLIWEEDGKRLDTFKSVKCKTPAQKITFDVSNSKSGFDGNVVIYKKLTKVFPKDSDAYTEEMVIQKIDFYSKGNEVMTVNYKVDFDTREYYEEGDFRHYKYIADINSFYITILAI